MAFVTEFVNRNTIGNSGRCREYYCTDRDADCESSGCCRCKCIQGTHFVRDTCSALPTTIASTPRPITTTRPPTTTKKPQTTTRPPTTTKKPPTTTRPPTTTKKPPTTTRRPTTAQHRPSTTKHRPTTTGFHSTTSGASTKQLVLTSTKHATRKRTSTKANQPPSQEHSHKPATQSTNQRTSPTKVTLVRSSKGVVSTTGVLNKENKAMTAGKQSQAGLAAGLCIGFILLIILVAALIYLRRRRQGRKDSTEACRSSASLKFQDLNGRHELESPASPVYEHTYDAMGRPNDIASKPIGNPLYNTNIPISGRVGKELESGEQPVYRELEGGEQVYMSPAEQPVYRELEESQTPSSPVYREIEENPPVYAEAGDQAKDVNGSVAGDPRMYQQLNYAATPNTYQPLSHDWKSQKYDR